MSALTLEGLHVDSNQRALLNNITVSMTRGELFGLVGPNGAGKSTLLKAVTQLVPSKGTQLLGKEDLRRLSPRQRATRLAYLAQSDQALWPLKVRDFVSLGRIPHQHGWLQRLSDTDNKAISNALHMTHLEGFEQRPMSQLSGGERARVRLARALAVQSPLLLVDEPVASLDPYHQLSVMELLRNQCSLNKTVVVVLHDLTLASRFCDRLLLLNEGHTVACGSPRSVLTPKNLQQIYQVKAMLGEHEQQPYVLPWACQKTRTTTPGEATP